MKIKRRTLMAGAAATTLARPAIAARTTTLTFVPQANLTSFDPVWTSASVTRNCATMVYQTLYGRDVSFAPRPLMVEGHVIEDDGKRWTMKLREGLVFHDGTPVRAQDCVASLLRWQKRDGSSTTFRLRVAAIEAKDDRTLVWRLHKPFPLLPHFLSKWGPQPVIVPERLAATDPFQQMTEVVGSGPFRFVPDEYVSGSRAVFAKFDRYVPRQEPASYYSGGHHVKVDQVEWKIIPDPATAANALAAGEVDWLELPQPDLVPMLRKQAGVTTGQLDIFGFYALMRPNHLQPPTDNVAFRRVLLAAIDQREEMIAVMGEDPSMWRAPIGFFLPDAKAANDAGMDIVRKRRSIDELKAMLEKSGYAGERMVFMHPTDQLAYHALTSVAAETFRRIGINVDEQMTDWGTIVQRRASKAPLDKGGWSLFLAAAPGSEFVEPLLQNTVRANGAAAWYGWADNPTQEAAYEAWIDASTEPERRRLEQAYQAAAFEGVSTIPLGQYLPHAAWRSNVTGQLKGAAPVFWNVEKT